MSDKNLVLVLGDQLSTAISSLGSADPERDYVLMVEVLEEATYVKHHKKKLVFIFSAMRHFAQTLRDNGWTVDYVRLNDKANTGSFQYTAIDHATRIRAIKIYKRHTQANAIKFVDYVIDKFPFRIREIRTENGHEFQARFHWHVEDKGVRQTYIKPRSPQLNGKVERSHRSDEQEFYQLLTYKDDIDLEAKLAEWERFYNFARPHGAFNGKTPYEALRERL